MKHHQKHGNSVEETKRRLIEIIKEDGEEKIFPAIGENVLLYLYIRKKTHIKLQTIETLLCLVQINKVYAAVLNERLKKEQKYQ